MLLQFIDSERLHKIHIANEIFKKFQKSNSCFFSQCDQYPVSNFKIKSSIQHIMTFNEEKNLTQIKVWYTLMIA